MDSEHNQTMWSIEPVTQFINQNVVPRDDNPPMTMRQEYRYTGHGIIHILTRDGLCYSLRSSGLPRSLSEEPGLTIYKNFSYSVDVKVDVHRESMSNGARSEALADALKRLPVYGSQKNLYVSHFISESAIRDTCGTTYVPDLDIVVSTLDPVINNIKHPFGSAAALGINNNEIEHRRLGGAHSRVILVDNERVVGDKWYRLGDTCIHLRPVVSDQLRSGLYIIYQGSSDYNEIRSYWEPKDVLSNKTTLRLFNSQAEAKAFSEEREHELLTGTIKREIEERKVTGGELGALRKERDDALARADELIREQSKQVNAALAQVRAETEAATAALLKRHREETEAAAEAHRKEREEQTKRYEEQTKRFEEERKRALEENERKRKDWYEERNYERKNWNEALKMLPATISVVLSIIVLFKVKSK